MIRLLISSLVLSLALSYAWPQSDRERAAASMAHAYCQQRPQPDACAPDGHPADALKQFMGLSTPPPGAPAAGR